METDDDYNSSSLNEEQVSLYFLVSKYFCFVHMNIIAVNPKYLSTKYYCCE